MQAWNFSPKKMEMLNVGDRQGSLQEKRGRREGPAKLWELVVWYVHVSIG